MSLYSGIYHQRGNPKLGPKVGVTNRMPGLATAGGTCPGASTWCAGAGKCYALKGRYRMHHGRYQADAIAWPAPGQDADLHRIHTAGDFATVEYIAATIQLANANPQTAYWAYTRSWRIPELLPALEELRALANVELFASTDLSIAETPPAGWRIAAIEGDPRYPGPVCMEQRKDRKGNPERGHKANCRECGYCWRGRSKNIIFRYH